MFAQKHCKTIAINYYNIFLLFAGFVLVFLKLFFVLVICLTWKQREIQISEKLHFYNFSKKNLMKFMKLILKFSISRLSASIIKIKKKYLFWLFLLFFTGLLLASNVQRWIRDVQKCSSLNQLWPEMSKLKSADTALNIAENAIISESALKMTEYLWELNPGSGQSSNAMRCIFIWETFFETQVFSPLLLHSRPCSEDTVPNFSIEFSFFLIRRFSGLKTIHSFFVVYPLFIS